MSVFVSGKILTEELEQCSHTISPVSWRWSGRYSPSQGFRRRVLRRPIRGRTDFQGPSALTSDRISALITAPRAILIYRRSQQTESSRSPVSVCPVRADSDVSTASSFDATSINTPQLICKSPIRKSTFQSVSLLGSTCLNTSGRRLMTCRSWRRSCTSSASSQAGRKPWGNRKNLWWKN